MKKVTIFYIVDSKQWVQHERVNYLRRYHPNLRFRVLTGKEFIWLWRFGFLRQSYLYFPGWRVLYELNKQHGHRFQGHHYQRFMASVTSHMGLGGGLAPERTVQGYSVEESFELATTFLKRLKVVTVNSMRLDELLREALPQRFYCPNGVDITQFSPKESFDYDPSKIRIGWVGRARASKNYETLEKACQQLEQEGGVQCDIILVKKREKRPLEPHQMQEFFHRIDYYLCTSWNEGTPNPALEAGACGVPVITTRVGNMPELIEEGVNGFFVDPTVESIVTQVQQLRGLATEDYQKLSQTMRQRIEASWSWEAQMKNYEPAFSSLLSSLTGI